MEDISPRDRFWARLDPESRVRLAGWLTLRGYLLGHLAQGRQLLKIWARRTWRGKLPDPIGKGGVRNRAEDRGLLICDHVEGFWRSSVERGLFRDFCLREWEEFGVPEIEICLDDVGVQSQLVAEFCEWLEDWPMPVIYRIPIDDGTGHLANDLQVSAKRISTEEAAGKLGYTVQHTRRLFETSAIPAWLSPRGEWLTTIADVEAYKPPENGGKRPGAGRPKAVAA